MMAYIPLNPTVIVWLVNIGLITLGIIFYIIKEEGDET